MACAEQKLALVRELSPPGFQVRRGMSFLDVFSVSQNFLLFLNALCSLACAGLRLASSDFSQPVARRKEFPLFLFA